MRNDDQILEIGGTEDDIRRYADEKYEQAYHFENEFLGAMRKIKPALLQENQSESST